MTHPFARLAAATALCTLAAGCAVIPADPYYPARRYPVPVQPAPIYRSPPGVYAYPAGPPLVYPGRESDWREREHERAQQQRREQQERDIRREREARQAQEARREQDIRRERERDAGRRERAEGERRQNAAPFDGRGRHGGPQDGRPFNGPRRSEAHEAS